MMHGQKNIKLVRDVVRNVAKIRRIVAIVFRASWVE